MKKCRGQWYSTPFEGEDGRAGPATCVVFPNLARQGENSEQEHAPHSKIPAATCRARGVGEGGRAGRMPALRRPERPCIIPRSHARRRDQGWTIRDRRLHWCGGHG